MYKILSINPGSTSTKIACYEDEKLIFETTIRHTAEELSQFHRISKQLDFRKELIIEQLQKNSITLNSVSAIVGRGGLLRPIESGVYEVNKQMLMDLENGIGGEHASNLGGIIAYEIASKIPNCKAYIADPVVVDELQDVARISGLPAIPRRSTFHALNHKATARKYAADNNTKYENLNLIIAHLGGGITVAAHQYGKVIDTNQGLDGYGPFSPERSGTLDAGAIVRICFEGKYSKEEILRMLAGKGGLMAHLESNDVYSIEQKINNGDTHAKLILEAMAYTVAKEIGAMHVVLQGKTDAIILTGGIAHSNFVVNYITKHVSTLAPIAIYPGENELEALAMSGLRIMRGEMPKTY